MRLILLVHQVFPGVERGLDGDHTTGRRAQILGDSNGQASEVGEYPRGIFGNCAAGVRGSDLARRMANGDGRSDLSGGQQVVDGDLQRCADGLTKLRAVDC